MAKSAKIKAGDARASDVTPADEFEAGEGITGDDAAEQEQAIQDEFGGDDAGEVTIRIFRRNKERSGQMPYLFTCSPADFPIMDRIRDNFGSGAYQARVYKGGRIRKLLNYEIEIAAKGAAPAAPAQDLAGVISAALERSAATTTALLEKVLAGGASAAPSRADALKEVKEMLALMREMAPAPAAAGLTPQEAIGLITQGVKLATDLGGGERGPTGLMDIVSKLLDSPLITKLLESTPNIPALTAPQPMPAAPATGGQGETTPAPAAAEAQQHAAAQLVQYVGFLVQKAASDGDIVLYADFVMDNVPREILAPLVDGPDAMATLKGINPQVGQYEPWFQLLIDEIRAALKEPKAPPAP